MLYRRLVRPLLFRALTPEQAHGASLRALTFAARSALGRAALSAAFTPAPRPVYAFGLRFTHPLGLAAGYDKDATAVTGLAALGFSHVEVGTVTPRPQPGNSGPCLFRLPADEALINRLGFPSAGADIVALRLARPRPAGLVLGVNLGKNRETPLEAAAQDYADLVDRFAPLCDYLAVNVSSPNTVGLRRLQARAALDAVLAAALARRDAQPRRVPLLVKLAPDLDDAALDDALDVLLARAVDGVIATNTTVARTALRSPAATAAGGLSGRPLAARATAVIRAIHTRTRGQLPIIGVGGIHSADSAQAKLDAGATLLQVYTGLVYAGPSLIRRVVSGLRPR